MEAAFTKLRTVVAIVATIVMGAAMFQTIAPAAGDRHGCRWVSARRSVSDVGRGVRQSPPRRPSSPGDPRTASSVCSRQQSRPSARASAIPSRATAAASTSPFVAKEHFGEVESRFTLFEEVVGLVGDRDRLSREAARLSRMAGDVHMLALRRAATRSGSAHRRTSRALEPARTSDRRPLAVVSGARPPAPRQKVRTPRSISRRSDACTRATIRRCAAAARQSPTNTSIEPRSAAADVRSAISSPSCSSSWRPEHAASSAPSRSPWSA